jgi:hypothetical protein
MRICLANRRTAVSLLSETCSCTSLPLHHLLFPDSSHLLDGGKPFFRESVAIFSRSAGFFLHLQACAYAQIPRELLSRTLQATRARVLNCSSPLKLLACPVHSQLCLVDHCHALQTASLPRRQLWRSSYSYSRAQLVVSTEASRVPSSFAIASRMIAVVACRQLSRSTELHFVGLVRKMPKLPVVCFLDEVECLACVIGIGRESLTLV